MGVYPDVLSAKIAKMTTKAMVVLSGGQDSTTCLGWALATYGEVHCITFDYGQRHRREVEAAAAVVVHFEEYYQCSIPHEILSLGDEMLVSTSPLTDEFAELETYADHATMAETIGDRVEKTFVPMRNTLFLTIAANRAVAAGCQHVVTGVCQEDGANYPDCRAEFIARLEDALNLSLNANYEGFRQQAAVHIATPLMHLDKAATVRLALELPYTYAALAWSHTAYDGQYPPTGRDHASVLRAHGFEQAGRPDPLVLRAHAAGLMDLPETENYRHAASFASAMKGDWT